jgi:ABC-type phosphate/phosphonate transport system substrate-binding protein
MSGKFNSILLVARTDKNINSIQNMRGKRLIMPENQELATVFLDTLVLKNLHIPYKKLFSSFITEKNDKRTLLDLFFDNADVALVNEGAYELMKELNPQFNEKTKVIASYLSKSKSYLFINKNAPFRQKLLDNYLQISSSVRGKQFLNLFQEEKLTTCSVSDLDTLDDLNREHGLLLKKYRIKLSKTGMN